MQLTRTLGLAALALLALAGAALADGEIEVRTAYYKERATRVEQPMVDARLDAGEHGEVEAHLLADAITSASIAAGAEDTAFSETRYEAGAGYTHTLGVYTVGATARYSTEPDYKAGFATVRGQAELLRRNLTLGLTLGAGRDDVRMFTTHVGDLSTFLASASVAQILSRNAIAAVTYDLIYLDGFQQNPYRVVPVRNPSMSILAMEHVPDQRTRHALAANLRYFHESTATTIIGAYRFYLDDWGIRAHTPELRVIQDAGETVQIALRYRYHRQGAADFFEDNYTSADPAIEPYLTADEKLSKFDSHRFATKFLVTGATFGLAERLAEVQGELTIEYDIQNNAFGNALEAQAAIKVPFEY